MSNSVIISGGGPVGLMCALGLARQGIKVDLFEAEPDIVYSPRAIGYAWPILEALSSLDLLDDMMAAGHTTEKRYWRVLKTGETVVLNHDAVKDITPFPYSLTLGQHLLAGVLLNHLERQSTANIHWSHRIDKVEQRGDRVEISAQSPTGPVKADAAWLIAADGGRSAVRKSLGIPLEGFTWERRFVATDIEYDFSSLGWNSCYLIDPVLGAVIYELNEKNTWRVTYAEDRELPAETAFDRIAPYMAKVLPGDGDYRLLHYSPYSMHQRTAPTYRQGRVLLAGDAAHLTNPTSGMGLMGGLYDAFSLSEALGAVVKGEREQDILDLYSKSRRDVFLDVTSPVSTESLRLCFNSHNKERLDWDLQLARERKNDMAAMRRMLSVPRMLETPSLLDGKTFAERL